MIVLVVRYRQQLTVVLVEVLHHPLQEEMEMAMIIYLGPLGMMTLILK
jgi:hypothetical protein